MNAIPSHANATQCLTRLCNGDPQGAADLFPLVYDELRALASAIFRKERPDHTLQPTAVVNELYLKLIDQTKADYHSRAHFLGVAARAIRQILIDHARRRNAAKRRAPGKIEIDSDLDGIWQDEAELLALVEALATLAKLNERHARIVELRFFGGLSVEETAVALGVSEPTVKRDWRKAREFLQRELADDDAA